MTRSGGTTGTHRRRRVGGCLALAVAGLVFAASAFGQATREQLEMLNRLPADQRAAMLEQLGLDENDVSESELAFPDLVLDRDLDSLPTDAEAAMEVPRLEPGDTLAVEFIVPEPDELADEPEEMTPPTRRVERLIGRNVFTLNRYGVLEIDDYYAIPLAGLSAEEAAVRIGAEADFRDFDVVVTLLPLAAVDIDALEPFGVELFSGVPTTFAPATDIPVPAEYVVGPGDTVLIGLYGNENAEYSLQIGRDGTVDLPGIGPVSVVGLRFEELKAELTRRIEENQLGVRVSVTLGELRSIQVFVLGDVNQPGAYTVSGLSTMTNALFVSGGIQPNGSMRAIQLKRKGREVSRLDLYDLLLRGDTRGDARLRPGDVIFVPPAGAVVSVAGEVRRPAIYELKGESTAGDAIRLAGGLLPTAFAPATRLERITADGQRETVDLDLSARSGTELRLRPGDVLRVYPVLEVNSRSVELLGRVYRPGVTQWRSGMRLTDLLPRLELLRPDADVHYVLIERQAQPGSPLEAVSADLAAALAAPDGPDDPLLNRRDRVHVLGRDADRSEKLEPLLERLRNQARQGRPQRVVRISGRVFAEGEYPLEAGMRISDLLRAGGGLQEAAYVLDAELARHEVMSGQYRAADLIPVDLGAILAGERGADLTLAPHDILTIKEIPEWDQDNQIEIVGEVRFPGNYIVQRGETLSSVLRRAGGLNELAFPAGSVFVREELRLREQEQLELLAARLEGDLVSFSLQSLQSDTDSAQVLQLGQSLLGQLRATEATGRLVIDIERVLASNDPADDIIVKNGDRLFVPKRTQEVTVLGEVQYATSHIYERGLIRDDYIQRSGGLTQKADDKRIYVVRANGAVIASERSAWFRRSTATEIRPGDTIVVPLDADRMSTLALWTNISQIVYQLALAAASANAVGVF